MKRLFMFLAGILLVCSGAFAQEKWTSVIVNGDMEGVQSTKWSSFWCHDWRTYVPAIDPESEQEVNEVGMFSGFAEIVVDPLNASNHCARVVIRSEAEANRAGNKVLTDDGLFASWDCQFFVYASQPIPEGKEVRLTFKVRGDKPGMFETQAHWKPGDYNHYQLFGSVDYTTSWQTVEVSTEVTSSISLESKGKFFQTAAFNLTTMTDGNVVYFDDIKFEVRDPKDPEEFVGWYNFMYDGTLTNYEVSGADFSGFTTFTGRDGIDGIDRQARIVNDPLDGKPCLNITGVCYEGYDEIQELDDDGNPILDEEGNPIYDVKGYFTKHDVDPVTGETIEVKKYGIDDWESQFFVTVPHVFKTGEKYRIKFSARADKPSNIDSQVHYYPSNYLDYRFLGSFDLEEEWQTFEFEDEIRSYQNGGQTLAFNCNIKKDEAVNYYFRFEEFSLNSADVSEDERIVGSEDVVCEVDVNKNNGNPVGLMKIDMTKALEALGLSSVSELMNSVVKVPWENEDGEMEWMEVQPDYFIGTDGYLADDGVNIAYDEDLTEGNVVTFSIYDDKPYMKGDITTKLLFVTDEPTGVAEEDYARRNFNYLFNITLIDLVTDDAAARLAAERTIQDILTAIFSAVPSELSNNQELQDYKMHAKDAAYEAEQILNTATRVYGNQDVEKAIADAKQALENLKKAVAKVIYIQFADEKVKRICVENWDTNGDGELSYDEAAAVKDLEKVFYYTNIASFDELKFFTGLSELNKWEFWKCENLTSITLPNSLTTMNEGALASCSRLKSVVIPESVTAIGDFAFEGCSKLASITIPKSVTYIGSGVLGECGSLTSVSVEEGNPVYDSRNNCNAIIETSSNRLIAGYKNTTIPNTVEIIGYIAFEGCKELTSFSIPNSVKMIEFGAYNSCTGLTSITIPKTVTYIGVSAFANCSGLATVKVEAGNPVYDSRQNCNAIINTRTNELVVGCKNTIIPNTVVKLEDYSFCGCTGLTSLDIPNSVTAIGYLAFSDCTNLTSITFGNSVTTIDNYAFQGCTGLSSLDIPNSVTTIGDGAFISCVGLTSLNIGESVTTIGEHAFISCTGLTSITIPNSVTSIGSQAFAHCNGITEIHSYIENPFSLDNNCWNGVDKSIPLYVPKGTTEKYQATDGWKEFTNIIEIGGGDPEIIPGDITGTGVVEDEDVDAFIELYLDDEIPEPGDADFSRFDANGDGIITLADAVAIFYLSNGLNFDGTDPNAARTLLIDNGKWIIDNYYEVTVEATELGNGIVRYTLTSDFEYAGFAIDVKGAQVVGESAEGMTLRSAETKGKHRIVAYNFGQAAAAGTVLTLDVLGEAQFSNINFSDANARNIRFRLSEATGIGAKPMDNGQWIMDNYYDLQGREKESLKKGVNIIRHANSKTMKVSVK